MTFAKVFFFLGAAERSVVNRSWLQFRKLPGNSESVRAPANFAAFGLFRESSDIFVHWHALPVQLRHFVCPRVGVTVRWSSRRRRSDVTSDEKGVFIGACAKPVVTYAAVCVVFVRSSAIL